MSMSADQIALARQYLADEGTSAVQSIQIIGATGGTFSITFNGQTTSALTYNATANVVQNALCALSNVGVGNLTVVGAQDLGTGVLTPYTIYFAGTLAHVAQAMFTVNDSLTPASASAEVLAVTNGGVQVFTDAELNALYSNAASSFFLAVAYAFRVLLANAAKFNDYTAGQTQEKKGQIFDHLKEMEALYREWAFAGNQVQFVTMKPVPPRVRAVPVTSGVPATSLQYGPKTRRGPWGQGN